MNAIQLSNLTKYYGKSRGILNLNLDVKEGEFFGFIGPTAPVNPPRYVHCSA